MTNSEMLNDPVCARCGCYRSAHGEDERCEPVGWTFVPTPGEDKPLDPLTLSEIQEQQTDELIKWSFRLGAQSCREMMARFVEGPGTETERNIACSIRANWHPGWGDDPGRPTEIARNALGDTDERDARHSAFAQRAVDHAMRLLGEQS